MNNRLLRMIRLLALTLIAAPALAAEDDPATAPVVQLLGRLHVAVIHFPIALLAVAALFEFAGMQRARGAAADHATNSAADACLALGALAAVVAAIFGWINAAVEPQSRSAAQALFIHRWLGVGVAVVACLTLVGARLGRFAISPWPRQIVRTGMLISAIGVLITGHFGGSLVHGDDYYSAVFQRPAGAAPRATESPAVIPTAIAPSMVTFEAHIAPIMEQHCVQCHGPNRAKGRLRLHTAELALDAIVPGDAARSELIRRVTLPPDDFEFMPATGEPLSSAEVEALRRWIDGLAPGAAPARPAPEPNTPATQPPGGPQPAAADELTPEEVAALEAIRARGGLASRISEQDGGIDVDFSLAGAAIGDADLDLLKGLERRLTWLDLSLTSVTDAGLSRIGPFGGLTRLELQRTAISDAGLGRLGALSRLEYLNLHSTYISDAGLPALAGLKSLRSLYVWRTGVTRAGAAALNAALPELRVELGEERFDEAESQPAADSQPASPDAPG